MISKNYIFLHYKITLMYLGVSEPWVFSLTQGFLLSKYIFFLGDGGGDM